MINFINNKKHWSLGSTLIITFIVFLIFSLFQSLVLILYTSFSSDITIYQNVAYANLGVISSLSAILGIAMLVVFIQLKNNNFRQYLNFHPLTLNILAIFLCISFCMMAGMEYVSNLYPEIFETDFAIESYKQAKSLPMLYLGVVLLGPIFEECLFRGFLFKGLEKSALGGHGAVFISAILFSLVHIQYGIYILVFIMLPIAILLGYARLKSGSLLLPIVIHVINNLATCLITHFEVY